MELVSEQMERQDVRLLQCQMLQNRSLLSELHIHLRNSLDGFCVESQPSMSSFSISQTKEHSCVQGQLHRCIRLQSCPEAAVSSRWQCCVSVETLPVTEQKPPQR